MQNELFDADGTTPEIPDYQRALIADLERRRGLDGARTLLSQMVFTREECDRIGAIAEKNVPLKAGEARMEAARGGNAAA